MLARIRTDVMISGGHRDKLLRRFGGALLEHQRRPRSAANAAPLDEPSGGSRRERISGQHAAAASSVATSSSVSEIVSLGRARGHVERLTPDH